MSAPRIAVVGGGLAGIAASLECARSGAEVTLLESRGRLGGAAYSFERDGIRADNGQHVFLRCCTAYRQLLADLGCQDGVTLQRRLDITVLRPGGPPGRLRRSALPAPLHLAGSLVRYRPLSPRDRIAVARAMQALRRVDPDDPAADRRSFGDWLQEQGQSPAAIEAVWDLIVRPTVNLVCAEASLAQCAFVFRVGLLEQAEASDIGYARVPLSELHDRAASAALERAGVEVRLRQGVASVVPTPGGFKLEISGGPTVSAERVILAVPPTRLTRLAPPAAGVPAALLDQLESSPIVNLHVVFDRPVTDLPFAAAVGSPVQWFFDRTASAGITQGQCLAISLSAADQELSMTAEELRREHLGALGALLPEARRARVEAFFVTREHSATFRAAPGSRALRPGPQTQLPGLALAGAFTQTGWPATMEGAVRSGLAAARHVMTPLPAHSTTSPPLPQPTQLAGSLT